MKIKTKLKACFVCILSVATGIYAGNATNSGVYADNPQSIRFTATVVESLSVTVTQSAAEGAPGSFLRSSFALDVNTNNQNGYIASMYSSSSTALSLDGGDTNINTLSSSAARSTFASANVNKWGYSIQGADNGDTAEGSASAMYNPMSLSTSPITIAFSEEATASASTTVYFGTQVDTSIPDGTYSGEVTVNVVSPYSGTPSDPGTGTPAVPEPTVPTNPNTPSQDTNTEDHYATYVDSTNTSVYVNPDNTNQTQIISGNYTAPLGATESTYYTSSNVSGGSSLATGLAVASATAAVSGGLFFVLAKFRDRDDDDE